MPFCIEDELKKVPNLPGVYLMHDETDTIIYVGKAKNLSHRLHQYFQESHSEGAKKDVMVTLIEWFEYVVTDSEVEALVLECNLIKEHRPKYNTLLTDDKTYPFVKVTLGEQFPRVIFSRELRQDGSAYFGPFVSAGALKDLIGLLVKAYRIRTCRSLKGHERACLNYHIGQCDAPCQGEVDEEAYLERIKQVMEFLGGSFTPLIRELKEKMETASSELRFEEAASYRDMYRSVLALREKQKITHLDDTRTDRDIAAVARDGGNAVVCIFFIRSGRMTGSDEVLLHAGENDDDAKVLSYFIEQFYGSAPMVPPEILLPIEPEDRTVLENYLTGLRGGSVRIRIPQRGEKNRMVELASKNAVMKLTKDRDRLLAEEARTVGAVREIETLLGEEGLYRMEAYDISNISGVYPVGSMVVYEGGKPKKSDYRRFTIKTVEGPDDYASMREVLTRRFTHVGGGFEHRPDVIMMDGGRGQVNICLEVLDSLGIEIPVCGMVKDERHRTRGLYFNNVELPVDTHSEAFRLITRIQDEAHRFAIEYHRSLRNKGQIKSILDDIDGVGEKRRKSLLLTFKSVDRIREATEEELAAAPSMNAKAAKTVWDFFHNGKKTVDNPKNVVDNRYN